jgi:hypothetical protein
MCALAFGKPDDASEMQAIPFVVWFLPVMRHDRVGEHRAVVWKFVYLMPRCAIRLMLGVSIRPPKGSMAEKPTSSSTTYRTLGAPSGAMGWRYGSQSGTESLMSTLTTPRKGAGIRMLLGEACGSGARDFGAPAQSRTPGLGPGITRKG